MRLLLRRLISWTGSDAVRHLLLDFEGIRDFMPNEASFKSIHFHRKNLHYKKAVQIAQMILLNVHPDISRDRDDVLALMFDMNDLWEQYAALQIRRYLRDNEDLRQMFAYNHLFGCRESILLYPGAVEGVSGGVSEGVSGEYRTPDGSRCHVLSLNVLDAAGRLMQGREFVRPLGEFVAQDLLFTVRNIY